MSTTAKPMRNRYKLSEIRRQIIDALGSEEVEVVLDDETIVTMPQPPLVSRAVKAELKALDPDDSEGVVRILLSPADFTKWEESGQDWDDIGLALADAQADAQDVLAGRKRPTRS